MKVRCERDGTVFEATIEPYPTATKPSKYYDKEGDKRIQCPTCGRAYFHYNGGTDVEPDEPKQGWHSDRPLTILKAKK